MKMKTFVRVISGVDTKGNDVSRTFPPVIRSEAKRNCGNYQGGAKVCCFK